MYYKTQLLCEVISRNKMTIPHTWFTPVKNVSLIGVLFSKKPLTTYYRWHLTWEFINGMYAFLRKQKTTSPNVNTHIHIHNTCHVYHVYHVYHVCHVCHVYHVFILPGYGGLDALRGITGRHSLQCQVRRTGLDISSVDGRAVGRLVERRRLAMPNECGCGVSCNRRSVK